MKQQNGCLLEYHLWHDALFYLVGTIRYFEDNMNFILGYFASKIPEVLPRKYCQHLHAGKYFAMLRNVVVTQSGSYTMWQLCNVVVTQCGIYAMRQLSNVEDRRGGIETMWQLRNVATMQLQYCICANRQYVM